MYFDFVNLNYCILEIIYILKLLFQEYSLIVFFFYFKLADFKREKLKIVFFNTILHQ